MHQGLGDLLRSPDRVLYIMPLYAEWVYQEKHTNRKKERKKEREDKERDGDKALRLMMLCKKQRSM